MLNQLYNEFVNKLQIYLDSIDHKDISQVNKAEDFLKQIIKRVEFVTTRNSQHTILEDRLIKELVVLTKSVFIKTNNDDVYHKKLQSNIERLSWTNQKYKINISQRKYTVAQREIFCAHLGQNIGSEQNGTRPVIILQNNTGNRKGNTTIVAPITTHQKQPLQFDTNKGIYYIEKIVDGNNQRKYLGHYEIPLILEGQKNNVYGFINVMHMREIDRKRIVGSKLGIATEECFNEVKKAIRKNLES